MGHLRRDERRVLDLYVTTKLVPALCAGDVVGFDNLSSHKSPGAARALRDIGAWFLFPVFGENAPPGPFLIPTGPKLNPIEMAFSKLKALIGMAVARTCEQLWQTIGHVCDLFTDEERYDFFKVAGYQTD